MSLYVPVMWVADFTCTESYHPSYHRRAYHF